ncbi:MAG: hypothetical protein ACYC1Q_11540 [Bacteroidia bacterium]
MIIKELIKEIEKQAVAFEMDVEKLHSILETDDPNKYDFFYTLIQKYKLHPRILDVLADQMQIERDSSLYSQYELEDVETLQKINLKINPSDTVVLASYLHNQYLSKDADQLEINLIDNLIQELEELKGYLNEES